MKSSLCVGGTLLLALVLDASSARAQPPETVTFRLQPERSRLVVHLFKTGAASSLAHDHVIVARSFAGAVQVDPQRPETARIRITVFTDGLEADLPALRRAYAMPSISDKDRRSVTSSMRSSGQLDTATYRTIQFASTAVVPVAGGFDVQGNLTIRAVTRPVRLHVTAAISGGRLKGAGTLTFRQSDFGYKPYSAFLGLVRVRDQAQMDIYLEGTPAQ